MKILIKSRLELVLKAAFSMLKNNDNFCCTCHIFNGILFLVTTKRFKQCFKAVSEIILIF